MNLSAHGRVRRAAQLAFAVGVAGAGLSGPAHAQNTDTTSSTDTQGVEVTGSRIRRVDTATSDAVQVLDRKQLEATGAATLGDLLQAIPSVGGTPINEFANNPYAAGASYVDLRGLGAGRTLVLLDGQRLNNSDVDAIPANMIERVEVLKEGAAAVYGTDAIGGVVNFVTRKNFTGSEANASYGATFDHQGQTYDGNFTLGTKLGKGSAMFGIDYNREDPITATSRDASNAPNGLYEGQNDPNAWASSRGPGGRFYAGGATGSCGGGLTRIAGTDGSTASDFRCWNGYSSPTAQQQGADPTLPNDRFNYQTANYSLDPTKRFSMFGSAQEPLFAGIKWFATGYFTRTQANNELAAEPFDDTTIAGIYPFGGGKAGALDSSAEISARSIYNPFGQPVSYFAKRANEVGPRILSVDTNTAQLITGFKGTLLDRFDWDAQYSYGHTDQSSSDYGFLDFSKVFQQIGPSFVNSSGVAHCGNPGVAIPNCTPVNVIGENTSFASRPSLNGAAITNGQNLAALGVTANSLNEFDEQDFSIDASGDIMTLPGGPWGLAVGGQYRALHASTTPDALENSFELSESNFQSTSGGYNTREAYAETHLPIVKNLPGIKSLALNAGARYSAYNTFGSTWDGKYSAEWKPYSDLLLRATYSDVYRAPSSSELYAGAAQSAPFYTDPCSSPNVTPAQLASPACALPDGSPGPGTPQQNTQANGSVVGNPKLNPEKGYNTDFGAVFSPSFFRPLSIEVDYWHYELKDTIAGISLDTILDACFADPNSAYCGNAPNGQKYFTRAPNGVVANSTLPLQNANKFSTSGIDGEIKLSFPNVKVGRADIGNFAATLAVTYLQSYQYLQYDPATGEEISNVKLQGQFDPTVTGGSFPHFRGQAFLFWNKGPFALNVVDRYVGNMSESQVDYVDAIYYNACTSPGNNTGSGNTIVEADPYTNTNATVTCKRNTGFANYVDMSASYAVPKINTSLTFGVNDIFSEGAQTQYNGDLAGAANPIYDNRGRNYFGRVSVRFK